MEAYLTDVTTFWVINIPLSTALIAPHTWIFISSFVSICFKTTSNFPAVSPLTHVSLKMCYLILNILGFLDFSLLLICNFTLLWSDSILYLNLLNLFIHLIYGLSWRSSMCIWEKCIFCYCFVEYMLVRSNTVTVLFKSSVSLVTVCTSINYCKRRVESLTINCWIVWQFLFYVFWGCC